jgi:hypothetical protein
VSVVAFSALVVFHGVLVAALAGRVSRAVPLLGAGPRAIAAYAPLLLLAPLGLAVLVVAIVGVMVVLASQIPGVVAAWRDRRLVTVGRLALAAVAVVGVPRLRVGRRRHLGPTIGPVHRCLPERWNGRQARRPGHNHPAHPSPNT